MAADLWLGDDDASATAVAAERTPKRPVWPMATVVAISIVATVVALFDRFLWSVVAYSALLVLGCGLVFYQRILDVAMTRAVGASAVGTLRRSDKAGIAFLVAGCLANGLVIAFAVARR